MDDVRRHNLDISRDDNEELFGLVDRCNTLIEEHNTQDANIMSFPHIGIFPFFQRARLKKLGKELQQLDERVNDWNKDANDFLMNRIRVVSGPGQDKELIFLHYTQNIRHLISEINSSRSTLNSNYHLLWGRYINQRNLLIALSGILISLVGLSWSLLHPIGSQSELPDPKFIPPQNNTGMSTQPSQPYAVPIEVPNSIDSAENIGTISDSSNLNSSLPEE